MRLTDKPYASLECPACKLASSHKPEVMHAEGATRRKPGGWQSVVDPCDQSEPAHPRCGACGVLMGPGHVEASIDTFCGTCRVSQRADAPAGVITPRQVFGRRGWQSDHSSGS